MYTPKPREAGQHQQLMCAAAGIFNDPCDLKTWASVAANVDKLTLDQATLLMAHLDRYVEGRKRSMRYCGRYTGCHLA